MKKPLLLLLLSLFAFLAPAQPLMARRATAHAAADYPLYISAALIGTLNTDLAGVAGVFGQERLQVMVTQGPAASALKSLHLVYYNYDPATVTSLRGGIVDILQDDYPTPGLPAGTSRMFTATRPLDLTPVPSLRVHYLVIMVYGFYVDGGSGYGQLTIAITPTAPKPLPVELVAFSAQLTGAGVGLAWATAQELNVSHFEIEKSPDGALFTPFKSVAAKGAGAYAAADGPPPATVYYRLKIVDRDLSYAYSPVRVVVPARQGRVVSRRYYDFSGRELSGPRQGYFVQLSTLDTGEVLREKFYQQ